MLTSTLQNNLTHTEHSEQGDKGSPQSINGDEDEQQPPSTPHLSYPFQNLPHSRYFDFEKFPLAPSSFSPFNHFTGCKFDDNANNTHSSTSNTFSFNLPISSNLFANHQSENPLINSTSSNRNSNDEEENVSNSHLYDYNYYTTQQQYLYNQLTNSTNPYSIQSVLPSNNQEIDMKVDIKQQAQHKIFHNHPNFYYPHYQHPSQNPTSPFVAYDSYSKSFLGAAGFAYQSPQAQNFIGGPSSLNPCTMFPQFPSRRDFTSSHLHHPLSPSYGQKFYNKSSNFPDRIQTGFSVGFARPFVSNVSHHQHHHELEEINTRDLAQKISSELKRYSIPQAVFAQRVLCRSQGTFISFNI